MTFESNIEADIESSMFNLDEGAVLADYTSPDGDKSYDIKVRIEGVGVSPDPDTGLVFGSACLLLVMKKYLSDPKPTGIFTISGTDWKIEANLGHDPYTFKLGVVK
jgi:hypothetical protein